MPIALLVTAGCSTLQGEKEGKEISTTGPTVIEVRANPEEIRLNKSMEPTQRPEILAEVKDFTSEITDVRLRFIHVPLELPMRHVGGTTWRAILTPEQVKTLAVGGETINYEANVVAKNELGETAISRQPVQIAVTTPQLTTQEEAG